jgi:hypothetical protein
VAVPLGTGIVLEREPTPLRFLETFVVVIAVGQAEKTQVFETPHCKLTLDCLLVDMLVLDDIAGGY